MSALLERLGARVASATETQQLAPHLSTDDLLARVGRRQQAVRKRLVLATATSTLLLVFGVLLGWKQATRGSAVATQAQPALGFASAEQTKVPLFFEDGTKIIVERGARAELKSIRKHGAELELVGGTLTVDVVHTDESQWNVKAGPFGIRVTGTRFEATFDPRTSELTVAMAEGTVLVSGPCVNEPLAAPARKVFACNITPPAAVASSAKAAPAPGRTPDAQRAPNAQRTAVLSSSSVRGDETAPSLLAVADEARLAGNATTATQLYSKIRTRFPGTEAAAKSAFLLGRTAEVGGSQDEAAGWYETVMRESPNGFAQEAHGRLLELEQRRGRVDRSRPLADEYLKRYPQGPHAAYASSIVDAAPR